MSPVLLDTNALLWFVGSASRLGRRALKLAENAVQDRALFVSAVSFWETALLVEAGRLKLHQSVAIWRHKVLALGIRELGLNGEIAIRAVDAMPDHADPADRFILATALDCSATLLTADTRLLEWKGHLRRHDARL
ncbi:MAG: type II toxin-antitoxin system VapC family toxin [Nevskia sp.]